MNETTLAKDKPIYEPQQQYIGSGGMTPSIITTINNTSPTPIVVNSDPRDDLNGVSRDSRSQSETAKQGGARSIVEPPYYESYIEDSFVGHWEREDDDPEYADFGGLHRGSGDSSQRAGEEEEDESMHPSTIEFDFDSFGPESFIYTPAAKPAAATTTAPEAATATTTTQTTQDQLVTDTTLAEPQVEAVADTPAELTPVSVIEQKQQPAGVVVVEEKEKESEPKPVCNSPTTTTAAPTRVSCGELKPSPVEYLVDPAQIDLKVIEPYKKVISHAGYCHHFDASAPQPKPGESAPAIIVFSACYLPDRSRRDYDYVMDHLFLYVLSSLHELIADDYILIYLHNTQPSASSGGGVNNATTPAGSNSLLSSSGHLSSPNNSHSSTSCSSSSHHSDNSSNLHQNNLPTFTWMKRCYQMIDRKLRKNLKILYLVKPTFWLKTIVIMCRPFISGKFSKKLRFIENMDALRKCIPVDQLILPASADCL